MGELTAEQTMLIKVLATAEMAERLADRAFALAQETAVKLAALEEKIQAQRQYDEMRNQAVPPPLPRSGSRSLLLDSMM